MVESIFYDHTMQCKTISVLKSECHGPFFLQPNLVHTTWNTHNARLTVSELVPTCTKFHQLIVPVTVILVVHVLVVNSYIITYVFLEMIVHVSGKRKNIQQELSSQEDVINGK